MKNLMIVCALLVSAISMQAVPFAGLWKPEPFVNKTTEVKPVKSKAVVEPVVVIEEDFSLFTAGTEDLPDAASITTNNYYVKNEYTHEPNWIGYNVHQAGGACALLKYTHELYGQGYGHISTPERELYGEVTVTFRARRVKTNPTRGKLWLALCDNTFGVLESTTFELTTQWQEFSWTTNEATFNDKNIMQFTPQEGEILIDDIKLVRTRNIIPPTIANNPINNSPTEFVASWERTTNQSADGYLFNVYYLDMPSEIVPSGTIATDFESINVNADGKTINVDNPGYPEGWYINVSQHGSQDVWTEEGEYNSGKQGLKLDAAGDTILSPVAPAPINRISFWIKPSSMTQESYNFSLVGVAVREENGEWEQIANIPNYWMQRNGGYYVIEGDAVGKYTTQVRITCESSYGVTFAIDDIELDYETKPLPQPLLTDVFVTDTFRVVSDIDPTKDHYYYVYVKEGDMVSKPSSHVWVDGLTGVTPVALPATDITETGFTANWETIYTADYYYLDVEQEYLTRRDNEEVLLTYEDFSCFTDGTISSPNRPWENIHYLVDNNESDQDWLMTQPQWAEGLIGTMGTSAGGVAGLVMSPKMILGSDPIKVDFTAYNTQLGDVLWVMVMEDYGSTSAKAAYSFDFSATKREYATGTIVFEGYEFGDTPYRIAFMTEKGYGFFIDEVKVSTIKPHANTLVRRPYKVLLPTENFYAFTNLSKDVWIYNYNVVARGSRDFVDFYSNVSETIHVEMPTAVNMVEDDNVMMYADGNALHVVSSISTDVEIYNLQGVLIGKKRAVVGDNIYPMSTGVYIVNVAGKVGKIVVQ